MPTIRAVEAERLRRLRERSGLTQADLAESFGVAKSAVAQWERGERTIPGPALELIDLYARHLGIESDRREIARPWRLWAARSSRGARAAALWLVIHGSESVESPVARHLRAAALRQFVQTLGGMKGLSAKFLDMVAYMDFVLPDDRELMASWAREAATPMPPFVLRDVFLSEFARAPKEMFREWNRAPAAVASIGQVHRAVTHEGQDVAVKVQHPRIVELLQADLRNIDLLDRIMCLVWPAQRRGEVHEELRERLLAECDYRLELDNMRAFAAMFAARTDLAFPRPIEALSGPRVLTATWIAGRTFDEFVRDASQPERDHAGRAIWSFFYESWLGHGRFHADPHPGNLVFQEGRVAFLDFGRVKAVSEEFRGICRRMTRALLECDISAFRRELVASGCVPSPADYDFHYAFRTMLTYYKPCLVEGPFVFTMDYVRTLWRLFTGNANRTRSCFPREIVFMEQFYFGVGSLLARIGASVDCRSILVPLLYEVDERGSAPPALGALQLDALGVS
jgi:predicted unusual protein kinase regulating ubiquinone biosynthesis (AarF/ABC1/UbiB family)